VVHVSEFFLAKGTFPATLAVSLRQSHVSPARSGARDATTGTKRWRRELWFFFLDAGASEAKWAHALSKPMEKWRVFLSALHD
jgi:hypothetical protein